MDENHINRAIGYGLLLIIIYYILGIFIPVLVWGVIGLIVLRIYQLNKRN